MLGSPENKISVQYNRLTERLDKKLLLTMNLAEKTT